MGFYLILYSHSNFECFIWFGLILFSPFFKAQFVFKFESMQCINSWFLQKSAPCFLHKGNFKSFTLGVQTFIINLFLSIYFLCYVQVVFILFKTCILLNSTVIRHIKRHMASRQINVNNIKSQPYGALELSTHTPFKFKGVQIFFFFFFPFTMLYFF